MMTCGEALRARRRSSTSSPSSPGHQDVEQHHVERVLLEVRQRRLAAIGQGDRGPILEDQAQRFAHAGFVVNDENSRLIHS
jgi:hypothetical protein